MLQSELSRPFHPSNTMTVKFRPFMLVIRVTAIVVAGLLVYPSVSDAQVVQTKTIYTFTDQQYHPVVIQATDGNFYTVSQNGYAFGRGAILRITPAGQLTVIHEFTGQPNDGGYPSYSGFLQGTDGYLYGITREGGASNTGTFFRMTLDGSLTVLLSYDFGPSVSALVQAHDGNFYFVYNYRYHVGRLTPAGVFTQIAYCGDWGANCQGLSAPVEGDDGNLYGVIAGDSAGRGGVYKIPLSGKSSALHVFNGLDDGEDPVGALAKTPNGDLYGVTTKGGTYGSGTVFRLSGGVVTTLRSLPVGNQFYSDYDCGIVAGADGYLYATDANAVVIRIHPTQLSNSTSTLRCFRARLGRDGNIYGVSPGYPSWSLFQVKVVPVMALDRTSLQFGAVSNGSAFTQQSGNQLVRMTQTGAGAPAWTATTSSPWITVTPASGTGAVSLSVGVKHSSTLPLSGTRTGFVTVTYTDASPSSQTISVSLKITNSSTMPAGAFDTPTDNSTGLSGSIAVTGWALDDLGVTRVRIFRDPSTGETPGQLVFIGNGTFVDGARPDVAATFSTTPQNTRAGWGYILLTNFLPNGGNGTFRLHAYADDVEGNTTALGSKTITVDNANATKPFGAIDTPGQGATVSGYMNNFGWVLARGARRADPPGGGSVTAYIDGVQVGAPSGWTSRSDLSAAFPLAQYAGINTALGLFNMDISTLANGVHTIGWFVTDNQGAADGVGSRFFTVANGAALTTPVTSEQSSALRADDPTIPIVGRRGFDVSSPLRELPIERGLPTLHGQELDRFEVQLPGATSGHLRTHAGLMPLPIGSHLDPTTGTFTWQAGPAFLGEFELVFGDTRAVRIVIHPKSAGRGPQLVIDTPGDLEKPHYREGETIVVGGWAADLDAVQGSGVSTVHVWAYPADGRAPIWIGAATYGGDRPDVAALFGERFAKSGFSIAVRGLAPGNYYLAAFPWSTVQRTFTPAHVVQITVRPPEGD